MIINKVKYTNEKATSEAEIYTRICNTLESEELKNLELFICEFSSMHKSFFSSYLGKLCFQEKVGTPLKKVTDENNEIIDPAIAMGIFIWYTLDTKSNKDWLWLKHKTCKKYICVS